jgi:hypothetical protein
MLYDPKWEVETKTDPLSLKAFVAWLEKQPPDTEYNYWCTTGECLLDTYISQVTGKPSRPSELHHEVCGGKSNYYEIAMPRPWTYGAALARARAAIAKTTGSTA